jgi:hypothetical protein
MLKKHTQSCEVCSAHVSELRRGRCWGCYQSWVETRPVGLGALCCMCGDRRHGLLKSVELLGAWVPICHNCAALAKSLQPMPQTISAIRETLTRDRRDKDRRWGKRDSRVFRYNRRGSDRRLPRDLSEVGVDDDMIVEISELVSELELLSLETMGKSQSDLTSIADRPNLSD